MTAKDELRRIYELDKRIASILATIQTVESNLMRVTPVLSDMPRGSSGTDKMADGISRLCELKEELNELLMKSSEEMSFILRKIDRISNETYRTILRERYVNFKSFEEISIIFPYTYNHVLKLHGHSLQEYSKLKK